MTYIAETEKAKKRSKFTPVKTGEFMPEDRPFDQNRADELHAKRHEYFQTMKLPRGCKSTADMIKKYRETGYR